MDKLRHTLIQKWFIYLDDTPVFRDSDDFILSRPPQPRRRPLSAGVALPSALDRRTAAGCAETDGFAVRYEYSCTTGMAVLAETVHEQSVPAADERADVIIHRKSIRGVRGKGSVGGGERGMGLVPSPGAARPLLRIAGGFAVPAVRRLAASPSDPFAGLFVGCLKATDPVRRFSAGLGLTFLGVLFADLDATAMRVGRFSASPGDALPRPLVRRGGPPVRVVLASPRAAVAARRGRGFLVVVLVRCLSARARDAFLGLFARRGEAPAFVRTLVPVWHVQHRYRALSTSLQRW